MVSKTWTSTDCKSGSKKPERRACQTAIYALCLAATVLVLSRSQLLSNPHTRSLCDDTNCTLSARLRGSQQLLQQAAQRTGHVQGGGAAEARQPQGQLDPDLGGGDDPFVRGGDGEEQQEQLADQLAEQLAAEEEEEEESGGAPAAEQQPAAEPEGVDSEAAAGSDDSPATKVEGASTVGEAAVAQAAERDGSASQGSNGEEAASGQEQQGGARPEEFPQEQQQLRKNSAAADEGGRTAAPSPYQLALEDCADLRCVAAAAQLARHPAQFRFPHFMIVGWQKCATTSLFHHLKDHPQILAASKKEPEFFSDDCGYNPEECSKQDQKQYIFKTMRLGDALEGGLGAAAVEASTHYGKNGRALAEPLARLLPWLRVVISMREPISRALSMAAHLLDKHDQGCLTRNGAFRCLDKALRQEGYAEPLQAWLEAFPTEQIYLIQYENITAADRQETVLRSIKGWLGIDPELPHHDLGIKNTREYHLMKKGELEAGKQAEGWPLKRREYEALVALVRPDAEKVAELATRHGLADGAEWMRNWEQEWQMTLDHRCKSDGSCTVHPN